MVGEGSERRAGPGGQGRRRIDRIFAADYLADIGDRPPEVVRSKRDECREEEARLSYTRRLLQASLDIARAEVARRADGGAGSLVEQMGEILADEPVHSTLGAARSAPLYEPPDDDEGRRTEDEVLRSTSMGRLPDLADDELVEVVERLAEEERQVSEQRRHLLERLDALQAELILMYRGGSVDVDAIMAAPATAPTTIRGTTIRRDRNAEG